MPIFIQAKMIRQFWSDVTSLAEYRSKLVTGGFRPAASRYLRKRNTPRARLLVLITCRTPGWTMDLMRRVSLDFSGIEIRVIDKAGEVEDGRFFGNPRREAKDRFRKSDPAATIR